MTRETFTADVDVIAFDEDARTIDLRVVPYGPQIRHNGTLQTYTNVAVPETLVEFTVEHFASVLDVVGRVTAHEQKSDGLYATVKLTTTPQAEAIYTLANDGLLVDVSAEVLVETDEYDADLDLHTRTGTLDAIAATRRGAFGDTDPAARILAVHDKGETMTDTTTDTAPEVVGLTADDVREIVDLSTMEDEIREMRVQMERASSTNRTPATPEPYEVFAAELHRQHTGDPTRINALREKFALDPTVGTSGGTGEAEGIIPAGWWAGGLVDVRGGWRPLFSRLGSMPYPASGTSVGYGKVVSGPDAGERSAQDAAATTAELIVDEASAAIKWFDGAGRIALELIEQSDPAVLAVFYGRLEAKINAKIENYACDTIAKGGTAEGAVLTLSSYAALVGDLVTHSEAIRQATDLPGDLLGCSTDDWIAILTMVDGNDRRLFATQGSAAADGSAGILSQSVDVGGVTAFHAPDLAESMQFNTAAAKGTDKAPRRVQAYDVGAMGLNAGLLGSAIVAPMVTGGIIYYAAALPT